MKREPGPRERKLKEQLAKIPPPPERVTQGLIDDLRASAALMAKVADQMQAGDPFAIGELGIHQPTRRLMTVTLAADALAERTLEHIRSEDAKEN